MIYLKYYLIIWEFFMSSGRLGAVEVNGAILTPLYTVPTDTVTTTNISICNKNAGAALIKIALINGTIANIASGDYIEFNTILPGNGVLERTGIVLQSGYTIAIESDIGLIDASCWGFEDSTV
jgi:hypothetical protein